MRYNKPLMLLHVRKRGITLGSLNEKRNGRRRHRQMTCKRNISALDSVKSGAMPGPSLDRMAKRAFDVMVAAMALVVFSPLLLLISVAINLDSRGRIFCREVRYNYDGETIHVLRFRSTDPTRKDAVTRVGRVLRRTGIDELPQLIAVLHGKMSIVGPYPYPIAPSQILGTRMPRPSQRLKPGIFGWAQVNGCLAEGEAIEQLLRCTEYDLDYIDNWSLGLEVKIIAMALTSKQSHRPAE